VGGVLLAAAWALAVEPRRLRVRRETVRLPDWPPELDGLRVAVVSDLHAGMPHAGPGRVARVADAVVREAPELILLLGDFVDSTLLGRRRVAPEDVARRLARARAPLGTVAVLGNHDWAQAGPRVRLALDDVGITVLENDAHPIRRNGVRAWIAGMADLRRRSPSLAALSAVPEGEPLLLLTHDPDVFPRVPPRVALTLAGHTHGGQLNVPLLRRRFIPSRHGARYRAGLIEEGGRRLYVSAGVGTTGIPARLFAPPEIAVLELRPL
jgi:uncharacterized protein